MKYTSLVELDPDHEPISYACLSHCWGSHQPMTTTTATIQQRKSGIAWHELPKTFQDALCLCSKLKLGYLWIDSLCIIQDDGDDWACEASKMAEVYSNSYITIAASGSRDGTEGCFRVTDCPAYNFEATFTDGSEAKFFVRKDIEHNYPSLGIFTRTTDQITTVAGSWPLMQRAWAFQERLLSPRVLHFGPAEVVWECQEHTLCKCSETDSQFASPFLLLKSDWFNSLRTPSQKTLGQLWMKVVVAYASRRLTFRKDVLPALSGLAKQFHRLASIGDTREYPGTYLAGMWRSDLFQQLLWYVPIENQSSDPISTTELPAPSWSWAARERAGLIFCEISFDLGEFTEQAEIVSCSCEQKTPHIYGEVVAGHLQLQAHVLSLRLDRDVSFSGDRFVDQTDDNVAALLDLINIRLDFEYHYSGRGTSKQWTSSPTIDDVYVANMGIGEATCVSQAIGVALVLRKTGPQEKFERIGIAFYRPPQLEAVSVFYTKGKSMLLDIV
jgi:hypothetical protein